MLVRGISVPVVQLFVIASEDILWRDVGNLTRPIMDETGVRHEQHGTRSTLDVDTQGWAWTQALDKANPACTILTVGNLKIITTYRKT